MNETSPRSRVLVVDDTLANLRLLFQILSQRYDVRAVNSGSRALESVRLDPPDLILLDIMMPGMSGYQVCAHLKADPRTAGIPVIFISALDGTDDKVRAFEAGGVDYVSKPLQVQEVQARVQTHLSLRELQEKLRLANEKLEARVQERTAELEGLNSALVRFVPQEFLDFLQRRSLAQVGLGDQVQQEMTILFSDIRNFTERSERMQPAAAFEFLNSYFRRIGPIIRWHRGFVDNYIGDGIMALFPGTPDHALAAAVAMQAEVTRFNQEDRDPDDPPLCIGIGIHTGPTMLGIIGEEQRLQSTVISAAVNLANRLESLTKTYSASIIVSEWMLKSLEGEAPPFTRFLDRVQVKGFSEPVSIFEVFAGDAEEERQLKLQTIDQFDAGLRLYYQREFDLSLKRFYQVLEQNPRDPVARIYYSRALHCRDHGVASDWSGVSSRFV